MSCSYGPQLCLLGGNGLCAAAAAAVVDAHETVSGVFCLFSSFSPLQTVHTYKPHFLAVHCQEVGGKNYEASMSHVDSFVK